MKTLKYTVTGTLPLLLNNPQTVDKRNKYAIMLKPLLSRKGSRSEEEETEMEDIQFRAKMYWDDELGVYIPSAWVLAAINSLSFKTAKIAKKDIRSSVFMQESKLKLYYEKEKTVLEPIDVVKNHFFRHGMILKQLQVKVSKVFPIFHKWSFTGRFDYDEDIIGYRDLKNILERACKYGGFGDFRPTFGRATVEVTEE